MEALRAPHFHSSSPVDELLAGWASSPLSRSFVHHAVLPSCPPVLQPLPSGIEPRLREALRARGVEQLYLHQLEATLAIRAGHDVVVATPTSSGKSLCYNLSVFQGLLGDPTARALYLFPTKALARDQVEEARLLATAAGGEIGVAVYDGDTPPDERRQARRRARIIATNPEMLHTGILPHHPSWAELFAGLRWIVIDELHTYRGVFGGHLAHVLRRLQRIARFHGADPRFVATSATIANPGELAAQLFGREAVLVAESGAPRGERHVLIYNPPLIDTALGLRGSYLQAACRLTRDLFAAGLGTLVFCRSRLSMEVLLRELRETIANSRELRVDVSRDEVSSPIRGYRGGYLPERRREVELALRRGDTKVVVSTSALELGIDIGSVDAVVIAGWPGSRASAWQRAGRAGRRGQPSLVVLVASSEPLDQHVAGEPDYLLGQAVEHARINPENASIFVPQLKCAAFELPFAGDEAYPGLSAEETTDVLACLTEADLLHRDTAGGVHYVGDSFPAGEVSLRGPMTENFLVIESGGRVVAEVDDHDAPQVLFEGAIYQLEGRQLQVRHLDHDGRKAFVEPVAVDYYTDAMTQVRVRILECLELEGTAAHGEVHVIHRVMGFKKIKLHTGENVGYGEVKLPDREMHTSGFWLTAPAERVRELDALAAEVAEAALGLSQALHTTAACLLMSDGKDLGRAVGDARATWFAVNGRFQRGGFALPGMGVDLVGPVAPTIFLYDSYPGGTGLSARLFELRGELRERTHTAVRRCPCTRGCPACLGPGGSARVKGLALSLLQLLEEGAGRAAAVEPRTPRRVLRVEAT